MCILTLMASLAVVVPVEPVAAADPKVWIVNGLNDFETDTDIGDGYCTFGTTGRCTLRMAVLEANATPGFDIIELRLSGPFYLQRTGAGEDAGQTGDIDIDGPLIIRGAGEVIDGNGTDRVFDVHAGPLTIEDLTIRHGAVAGNGGAIRAEVGTTLENVRVEDSSATGSGGGLSIEAGAFELTDSTIDGNEAVDGGGVALPGPGSPTLTIDSSTISANTASDEGGGGWHESGATVALTNSTISANVAATGGGWRASGTQAQAESITMAGNEPSGLHVAVGSDFALTGSIIQHPAGAVACTGVDPTSAGRNLASDATCGLSGTADLTNTDAQLEALVDTGGPTATYLPASTSPAVDSGGMACPWFDQRGVPRPTGAGCDRGAVERHGSHVVTTTADVVDPADGVLSLREAVSAAVAAPSEEIVLAADQTYLLTQCDGPGQEDENEAGDLDLTYDAGPVTIEGNGATIEQTCVGDDERVLQITAADAVITDLTITGGDVDQEIVCCHEPKGGGVLAAQDLVLDGVSVVDNHLGTPALTSDASGGGLHVGGDLVLRDSSVIGNTAAAEGDYWAWGAGLSVTGHLDMLRSHVDNNDVPTELGIILAAGGGAAVVESSVDHNSGVAAIGVSADLLSLVDSTVDFNTTGYDVVASTDLSVVRSSISGNEVFYVGAVETEDADIVDSVIEDNTGGLATVVVGDELYLEGSDVLTNVAQVATIAVDSGPAVLEDSSVSANAATIDPLTHNPQHVGIMSGGPLTVTRSTVSNNTAGGANGGSSSGILGQSTVTIVESTIDGNIADGTGFAGVRADGDLVVDRSTVARNVAGDVDGSVAGVVGDGSVTATESTVALNEGGRAGVVGDDVELVHATVVQNEGRLTSAVSAASMFSSASVVGAGVSDAPACSVSPDGTSSGGFNVVEGDGCPLDAASDHHEASIALGTLQDNGGPTETISPGSFLGLIPTGRPLCEGADQRGVARPQGFACEPGAMEADEGAPTPTFSDVPSSHPFFAEVECLVLLGATEGFDDGTFRPTLSITRQAVVAWLWRLAGSPEPAAPPTFSDVPEDHPFADAIAWAAEEDIVEGFPDGSFRPGATVTRQAVAAWLWRQTGSPPPGPGAPTFSDVPPTHPFADAIRWLAEEEITTGFADGTFRPGNEITRMALAAWVCRS